MALNWICSEITDKKIWTDGLFTIQVRAPGVKEFEPGQFLQVGLSVDEKHVHRPYSVASPHGELLEFFIVLVEDGELTPLLYDKQVGDQIDVSDKGTGSFVLSKSPSAQTLWLVGTGTGLAPYIAMLRCGKLWDDYENVVIVHGARYANDLAYQEELRTVETERAGRFHYLPVLTREEHDGTLFGRIPACLKNGALESSTELELNATNSTVLLCGNPAMLDDMEEALGERGLKKHRSRSPGQIVLERYW